MFRKILVPVSLNERASEIAEAAAELAQQHSASLTLLHVIEEIEDLDGDETESFYEGLRERAEASLDSWAAKLAERGLEVEREVLIGKRGPAIVRRAESLGCDLVVVGSHKVDPDDPTRSLGTTSHQVALMAGCHVLLVR
ncbi:MAG: universal stress protein [Deltaproteobacteria bacterium]|nr:universal stress protein [Deltaproteobacteria bacterium]MBW2420567.1 universal stress protein [Deltaproteobacteria bacterium]